MRSYEVMYIVKPTLGKQETKTLITSLEKVITKDKGKIKKRDDIGLKDLAYPIEKFDKGYYYWMLVEAEPATIAELKRKIGITEDIIRFIIVKEDE